MSKMDNEHQYEKVPTKEKIEESETEIPQFGYGVRHAQALLFFGCLSVGFIARGHLGVTIVAMTNPHLHNNDIINKTINNTLVNDTTNIVSNVNNASGIGLNVSNDVNTSENNPWNVYRTYDWSKSIQEMALGSFFLGYCIMMFPIGMVCQRWGGKLPLQIALFVNGVVSILTPSLAVWGGWKAVCFCRILQGLSQAGVYPGIHTLLAIWVPISERGRLTSYVYTGTTFGTVIAFQISGVLADSTWGWPSIFWVTGVLCIMAFVLLTIFGAATPADHKGISAHEKNFILGRVDDGIKKKRHTPWRAILTSKHVWANISTHIGSGMSFVFFFTQVPSYMHYILGVDVKNSGFLSSLPYVACVITTILYGLLSDYCTNRNIITLKTARRISNSFGQVGYAIFLTAVSFTHSTALAVICLVTCFAMNAAIHTGWIINHIDLAPNYSGTLMATGNTFTNFCVLSVPLLVSNIVTDVTNPYQWRIMCFLIAGIALTTNTIFVIFMSADTQPWNDSEYQKTDQEDGKIDKKNEAKE